MKNILFEKNLRQLMRDNKITQLQLAKEIGVSQSAISNWLSGKKEPSILSLWLVADFFYVTVDFLIGRNEF